MQLAAPKIFVRRCPGFLHASNLQEQFGVNVHSTCSDWVIKPLTLICGSRLDNQSDTSALSVRRVSTLNIARTTFYGQRAPSCDDLFHLSSRSMRNVHLCLLSSKLTWFVRRTLKMARKGNLHGSSPVLALR